MSKNPEEPGESLKSMGTNEPLSVLNDPEWERYAQEMREKYPYLKNPELMLDLDDQKPYLPPHTEKPSKISDEKPSKSSD